MGCACSKTSAVEDSRESPRKRLSTSCKKYSELNKLQSHRREGEERAVAVPVSSSVRSESVDSKPANGVPARLGAGIPKAGQAEQVAAGWPAWLSAAASEAIKGWVPRRADTFEKLYKIGQGTYSSVYKARDMVNNRFVALKKVRFDNLDSESVKFMAREILVLRRLDHPNIIKLEGLIASPHSCSLYLVFEYMEHDLTGLASRPEIKFTESQVKCYMQQLLRGLDHCHRHGVLHRDIKGSNLLIDNNGVLKIADFGLASFYDPKQRHPLTSRVVTLWYRPPELLLGASHYGVAVDLWSAGCILGELYSGKPILPGKTEVEQLHKIFKLCGSPSEEYWSGMKLRHSAVMRPPQPYRRCVSDTFRELPVAAVSLIDTLLSLDPASRQTADFALKTEFFTTKPLACDPSSLPKYPPSKEIDAKLREDEARRQRAVSGRGHNVDLERRGGPLGSHAIHPPNVNLAMMTRGDHASHSEILGQRREVKTVSGILADPAKPRRASGEDVDRRVSMSGPLGRRPRPVAERDPLAASARPTSNDPKPGPSLPQEISYDERKHRSFKAAGHDQKASSKDSTLYGSKTDKIYVSGPLLVSSNNVEQMLKDHDRRIQEFARKTRLAKPGSGSRHQSHVAG